MILEIIFNPFVEDWIPFIKYKGICKSAVDCTATHQCFFEVEDIEDEDTLKKVTMYYSLNGGGTPASGEHPMYGKLLIRIYNENYYV